MPIGIKNLYTCPKCGHSVGKWGWHKCKASRIFGCHWPCKNCGTILGLNPWQRTISILVCAASLYLLFRPATSFQVGLFILSIGLCDLLASIFLVSIVEKSATEYIPRRMKGISECPKCGHPVGLRHRWNTAFYSSWPCQNCGTLLGFRYWKSAIFISFVAVFLSLWVAPHVRLLTAILFALTFSNIGMMLANTFCNPIVEKGARQKFDSD